MTINWTPTIHEAYTTPNLPNSILQQAIPSLIRDEIHRLANQTLFQNNFQSNSETLQVPVDMSFTDNSLKIRLSENAPWISLLPSTAPMSPEEQNIDIIRRDVMAKVALLWGGTSSESSNENNQGSRNISISSSPTFRTRPSVFAQSRGNRSKRGRRAQQDKSTSGRRGNPITLSNNKIDLSNHSNITNNYYSSAATQPLLDDIRTGNTHPPKTTTREMGSQTVTTKDQDVATEPTVKKKESTAITLPTSSHKEIQTDLEETDSIEDSQDNLDSSSYESEQGSTGKDQDVATESPVKKKASTATTLPTSSHKEIQTDLEETHSTENSQDNLDSSSYESEQGSTDSKTEQQFSNNKTKEDTTFDPEIEDSIEQFEKLQINDSKKDQQAKKRKQSSKKPLDISSKKTPILRKIPSKASIQTDSLQIRSDSKEQNVIPKRIEREVRANTEKLAEVASNTTDNLERDLSDEQIVPLEIFLENSIEKSDTFTEIANSNIPEIDRDLHESLHDDGSTVVGSVQTSENSNTKKLYIEDDISSELAMTTDNESISLPEASKITIPKELDDESTIARSVQTVVETDIERILSDEKLTNLQTFLEDSIRETNASIVTSVTEEELTPSMTASLLNNKNILLATQKLLESDPQLVVSSPRVNELLNQLDLSTLRVVHNDDTLEVPSIHEDSDDESTIARSVQTVVETDIERILSDEELTNLQTFLEDSIRETNASIVTSVTEEELTPSMIVSLVKNKNILLATQKLLESDPQLVVSSPRVNELLNQLDLSTLRVVHNDDTLEVPSIHDDRSTLGKSAQSILVHSDGALQAPSIHGDTDDESTIAKSVQTVVENVQEVTNTNDDLLSLLEESQITIPKELIEGSEVSDDTSTIARSVQTVVENIQEVTNTNASIQTDEDTELLEKLQEVSRKSTQLEEILSQTSPKSLSHDATTETIDHKTDKEIKLQKKVQELSKKYENLAGAILKHSSLETRQHSHIRELQFELVEIKKQLQDSLAQFERLAESEASTSKLADNQSDYIRKLEGELEDLQELLSSITISKSRLQINTFKSKEEDLSQIEIQDDDSFSLPKASQITIPKELIESSEDSDDVPPILAKPIITQPIESSDEQQDLNELLSKYREVGEDLERVNKDDLQLLASFYTKYAVSGMHLELGTLADHLRDRDSQDALLPNITMVLKRKQDLIDTLRLAEQKSSQERDDTSTLVGSVQTVVENVQEVTNTNVSRQTDEDTELLEKLQEVSRKFTQLEEILPQTSPKSLSHDATTATIDYKTDKEIKLQIELVETKKQLQDSLAKFEKLAESEKVSDDTSTIARSVQTVVENVQEVTNTNVSTQTDEDTELLEKLQEVSRKFTQLEEILPQTSPKSLSHDATTETIDHKTDKEIKLQKKVQELSKKYENLAGVILKHSSLETRQHSHIRELQKELARKSTQLEEILSQTSPKSLSHDATTETIDHKTDKEIKLQKKVQELSKKYENLAGTILKHSSLETKQHSHIRELQKQLQDSLAKFEKLAESEASTSKLADNQSDDLRKLEGELEALHELLSSIDNESISSEDSDDESMNSITEDFYIEDDISQELLSSKLKITTDEPIDHKTDKEIKLQKKVRELSKRYENLAGTILKHSSLETKQHSHIRELQKQLQDSLAKFEKLAESEASTSKLADNQSDDLRKLEGELEALHELLSSIDNESISSEDSDDESMNSITEDFYIEDDISQELLSSKLKITTDETIDHKTDKEIKLQKKVRELSKRYENLAGTILKHSSLETRQHSHIRELQKQLQDSLAKFEKLAESEASPSKLVDNQSDDLRKLKGELKALHELLSSIDNESISSEDSDQTDKLNRIALDRELSLISLVRDREETISKLKDIITRVTQAHLLEYKAFKTMPTLNQQKIPMAAAIVANDIPTPVNTVNRPEASSTVEIVTPEKIPAITPTPNKTIRRKKLPPTKASTSFESDQDQLKREVAAMNMRALRMQHLLLETKKGKSSQEIRQLRNLHEELIRRNQKSESNTKQQQKIAKTRISSKK